MPPKTPTPPKKNKSKDKSKDQSAVRAKSSRAAKKATFPAQTLAEMKCVRARIVAASLKIHDYARLSWPSELAPQIKLAMAKNTACLICGGGQCNPETHRFPSTNPYVEVDELGNPLVDEESDEGEDGSHRSPHTSNSSPSRHTVDALSTADNPQDRVVTLSEQAPGFIQTLVNAPASGSGIVASPKAPTTTAHPPDGSSSEESLANDESDSPVDSDLDKQLEEDAEFQKELEELRQQQLTEKNTAINAKEKKKKDKLTRKKARDEAEARKKERRKHQLEERRKQVLAGMMARHQEEMAAAEAEEESSDDEVDEVFSKASDKNSTRSPRSSSRKGKGKKSVNIADPPRSHSARPVSESDPSAGLTMASVLKLMDRQHKNTLKVVESALSVNKPSRVPVSELDSFGHETPSCGHEQSGRARVILPENPAVARELGLNPPINLAFQGKMENIDLSKIKKTMTSGKNRSAQGLVLKQVLWPHDCISKASRHILGYSVKIKHENQTFAMFNEGMAQMMLLDTPQDKMDPILKNRLRFQSFIIRQSYVLGWKECLTIVEDFFEACEYNNISWDDWPEIERFLKESAEQIRLSASFRGRANSAPPGAGNPNGGQPGKRFSDNANGVPSKWMVENKICVAFNLGYCPNQKGGDHTAKNNVTLRHWCGGCYKKSNSAEKLAHPASTCGKGPFANLFV